MQGNDGSGDGRGCSSEARMIILGQVIIFRVLIIISGAFQCCAAVISRVSRDVVLSSPERDQSGSSAANTCVF